MIIIILRKLFKTLILPLASRYLALLEARGEILDVRNRLTTPAADFHSCGLDRGKKQEFAFYSFAQTYKNAHLASCF